MVTGMGWALLIDCGDSKFTTLYKEESTYHTDIPLCLSKQSLMEHLLTIDQPLTRETATSMHLVSD